jgi:hypothetical protein
MALKAQGIAVISTNSVADAKSALAGRTDVAGALVDVHLRNESGIDFYHWLVTHHPSIAARVAFVTGGGGPLADQAVATGRPVIGKPFELADIVRLAVRWKRDNAFEESGV